MTEMCKTCLFKDLCAGFKLPHCYGEDYVKKLGGEANERK